MSHLTTRCMGSLLGRCERLTRLAESRLLGFGAVRWRDRIPAIGPVRDARLVGPAVDLLMARGLARAGRRPTRWSRRRGRYPDPGVRPRRAIALQDVPSGRKFDDAGRRRWRR